MLIAFRGIPILHAKKHARLDQRTIKVVTQDFRCRLQPAKSKRNKKVASARRFELVEFRSFRLRPSAIASLAAARLHHPIAHESALETGRVISEPLKPLMHIV